MPPFLIPVLANVAAAAAYDALRARAGRFIPRAAPPPLAVGGGPARPWIPSRGRTAPIYRLAEAGERRGR